MSPVAAVYVPQPAMIWLSHEPKLQRTDLAVLQRRGQQVGTHHLNRSVTQPRHLDNFNADWKRHCSVWPTAWFDCIALLTVYCVGCSERHTLNVWTELVKHQYGSLSEQYRASKHANEPLPVPKLKTVMSLLGLFIRTAAKTRRLENAVGFLSTWSKYSRYEDAAILSWSVDEGLNNITRYWQKTTNSYKHNNKQYITHKGCYYNSIIHIISMTNT